MENVMHGTATVAASALDKDGLNAPTSYVTSPDSFQPQTDLGASRYRCVLQDDRPLDALLVNEGTDVLIVTFHGALDRKRFDLPRFERLGTTGEFAQSMLFFSDPGLFADDSIELAWFTGWPGVDLQPILAEWATRAAQAVGASRIIFTGSSGGGFAALQVSALVPGSVCLAFNPQTSIHGYLVGGHGVWVQRKYIEVYHPELITEGVVDVDFTNDWTLAIGDHMSPIRRYSVPVGNHVLYADNPNDFHHAQHLLPFQEAVAAGENCNRFRVHTYDGSVGHEPPSPPQFREAMTEALRWCQELPSIDC
ncbi:hypothetical protein ACWGQ2_01200 [Arthrobacter sp. NPDC055585]